MVSTNLLSPAQWDMLSVQSIIEGKPLDRVHVITTHSDYVDRIYLAAVDACIAIDASLSIDAITECALSIAQCGNITVRERVDVQGDAITVYVDAREIDELAVSRCINLLAHALDALDGQTGEVEFGHHLEYDIMQPSMAYH